MLLKKFKPEKMSHSSLKTFAEKWVSFLMYSLEREVFIKKMQYYVCANYIIQTIYYSNMHLCRAILLIKQWKNTTIYLLILCWKNLISGILIHGPNPYILASLNKTK